MTTTIADQVYLRVVSLMEEDGITRAEAIRRVAGEMDRSVSATSSAYSAGARRAAPQEDADAPTSQKAGSSRRGGSHSDSPRLYAEMLPLVEAGASVEQAARRFGDDDSVDEIAAGFTRWASRQTGAAEVATDRAGSDSPELDEARERVRQLEAENRLLRRDLARATQTLTRARVIIDAGLGETGT